jgi:hypothetical protein
MESARQPFSTRDWFGLVAGVCVGLVLSRFFASDDMTGPWLVILLGPPIVLLISSTRPILSWQVPIVTAATAAALMNRSPEDSTAGIIPTAVLFWFICSLLSSPWALIFYYRARRFRRLEKPPAISIAYVGMVVLVFVCCALTFLGFAATVYPIGNDAQNRGFPFYGVLAVTGGIALSIVTERVARRLEVHKPVRAVFEVLMIPGVVLGVAEIVDVLWSKFPGQRSSVDASTWCGIFVGLEALAAMIYLVRLERREPGVEVQA